MNISGSGSLSLEGEPQQHPSFPSKVERHFALLARAAEAAPVHWTPKPVVLRESVAPFAETAEPQFHPQVHQPLPNKTVQASVVGRGLLLALHTEHYFD